MSFIIKFSENWHPLARLNLIIALFFVVFQACAAVSLLTIPPAIDTRVVSVLLALGWVWWITVLFSLLWSVGNAGWLSYKAVSESRRLRPRNLVVAWGGPVLLVVLIFTWQAVISLVTGYRLERDFENSRSDFLVVCSRVLDEGAESEEIRNDRALGVFESVDVLYDDRIVYFELGDDLRAYGYACVPDGTILPATNDLYDFEKIDDRFYNFSEIENRLTPQPETPTPELTPQEE